MTGTVHVQVRRVYEKRLAADGARVLVDRIWPRGLTKREADLDEWCKEVEKFDSSNKLPFSNAPRSLL